MVKPNTTPATDDKAIAEKILTGQEDLLQIFKKVSYDDLKVALENWLNPDDAESTTPSAPIASAPAGVKKTDDIDTAFDDLFNQ